MGNFDGCTKRGLGDPSVEIRRTIRPGKGGGGGVGQQEGGASPRQASPFVFPRSLLPSPPSPHLLCGVEEKRGAVKLERVPDI